MQKNILNILVNLALFLHRFTYKLVSALVIRAEGGLHPKHRLMNYHAFFVDHISSDDSVLDIGCGNGALAYDLAQKAVKVTAIDLNEKNRRAWEKKYPAPNLTYHVADAMTYQPEHPFNVVVLSNVLEHIETRVEFLRRVASFAPTFLIRVPMINRDWITLYQKERGLEYRLDKTHFTEYTLEEFQKELASSGLVLQEYSVQFGEIWAIAKRV